MALSASDLELLTKFERGLDPQHPERSTIPARILGYGEISTVFEIDADGLRDFAFKRLPLFYNANEVEKYTTVHAEYNRLLENEIGIRLPSHDCAIVSNSTGRPIVYIIQKKLPAAAIGNRTIHTLAHDQILTLVKRVLHELNKVWEFNRRQTRAQVGIDGQISNWVIDSNDESLLYVDTSTPLFRIDQVEQLDTELFLRSAPSFLVWILRWLFLKDVVNRYYDFRLVAVDLVANFYKEQKPELIPDVIQVVNDFFSSLNIQSITEKQVNDYYKEDALIWSLYFNMRRVDRFLHTRILRKEYPYILPGKIKR
ncbi:MAG: hypothetical protein HZB51_22270 [Chloroflexi bacterium]|nr:hypothetical protein [Chloroflexota bacterium]